MQIRHADSVLAFAEKLKAEHLTQSDPSVQARVLELAGKYFDPPTITQEAGGTRRSLGLVPDGVITDRLHPDTAGAPPPESEPVVPDPTPDGVQPSEAETPISSSPSTPLSGEPSEADPTEPSIVSENSNLADGEESSESLPSSQSPTESVSENA